MTSRKIVANLYPPPSSSSNDALLLFADDPVIQLVEGVTFRRNKAQRAALVDKQPERLKNAVFGPTLEWAYREYIVHRLDSLDIAAEPLGNAVPAPVDAEQRASQLRAATVVERRAKRGDRRLYLFSVIVALEWVPTSVYLRQLEWGFRRASDLLFDVSNGTMAFGQIVFADSDWMDCADIQITASNQTLPRSWVSGLHEAEKYMPIRVGRGVWSRRARRALPWDEPEAYRTLVHEWAHYALDQRDSYLVTKAAADCGTGLANEQIVVPAQRAMSESIMATPDGNSELENPLRLPETRFPRLNMPEGSFPGPGRLPLPLPVFVRLGQLEEPEAEEQILQIPPAIPVDEYGAPQDEWTTFVLRYDSGGAVERIVAQGVLDISSGPLGFSLLGARPNDRIVIYGNSQETGTAVFSAVLQAGSENTEWDRQVPTSTLAAVKPPTNPYRQVQQSENVTVTGQLEGKRVTIYPMGKPEQPRANRQRRRRPQLDGYLLLESEEMPIIMSYSQGGSPWTTTTVTTNPIPAGSSEGDLLLFFSTNAEMSEERRRRYADVRIVTTTLPAPAGNPSDDALAVSKVFGVASNARLDPELSPTAVFFFDPATMPADHQLQVIRINQVAGAASELPTCVPRSAGYAAVPLAASLGQSTDEYAGGTLLTSGDVPERVEYFQLIARPTRVIS